MEFTFQPTRSLTMKATIASVRNLALIPWRTWLFLYGFFSGMPLLANLLHVLAHEHVQPWRWFACLLFAPALCVLIPLMSYLTYRFCGSITVRRKGLYRQHWGKVLSFWKPVECRVKTLYPGIYSIEILCKTPLSKIPGCSQPRLLYHSITENLAHAEAFARAFREQYPPQS